VRSLALALCLAAAAPALADPEEPREIPIVVPTPIPVGFLVAWKPTLLSVRVDSGAGGARVWQSGPVGERGVEIVQIGNVDLPVLAKHRSGQIAPANPEVGHRNL